MLLRVFKSVPRTVGRLSRRAHIPAQCTAHINQSISIPALVRGEEEGGGHNRHVQFVLHHAMRYLHPDPAGRAYLRLLLERSSCSQSAVLRSAMLCLRN